MKRRAILAATLAISVATHVARADSAAVGWDQCGSQVLNKAFACDTDVGGSRLVVSALRDAVPVFTDGFRCVLEVAVDSPSLPAWWLVKSGGCRAGAITADASVIQEDLVDCANAWSLMGATVAIDYSSQNRLRITLLGTSPSGDNSMSPGVESFIVAVSISHEKSVGTGNCAGCGSPACVMLRELTMVDGFPTFALVTIPIEEPNYLLAWQSTRSSCIATPARNSTWGRLKSLYR